MLTSDGQYTQKHANERVLKSPIKEATDKQALRIYISIRIEYNTLESTKHLNQLIAP